jgi:hypothetical protein
MAVTEGCGHGFLGSRPANPPPQHEESNSLTPQDQGHTRNRQGKRGSCRCGATTSRCGGEWAIPCHNSGQPLAVTLVSVRHVACEADAFPATSQEAPPVVGPRTAGRHARRRVQRVWARRVRARVRARRRGSGVRARRVAARTTWTASWASVCQAAWTATGLAPGRVRTQQPTTSPSSRSGAVAARCSAGQAPWASSGRVVTPTVGRPSTAPRWKARPARRDGPGRWH